MKVTPIIITAVIAGVAGALAGILFAPGKGSQTRGEITQNGQKYRDYFTDNFDDFADSVSRPFETLEEETRRLSKKANSSAKEIREEVRQELI